MIDGVLGHSFGRTGPIGALVSLATICPSLAAGARRLHGTDRSGWWQLLVLVPIIGWILLLIWLCSAGTPGGNRFGGDTEDRLRDVFA